MAKASSGEEGIKNRFFWDLKRLFPQKPEEVEDDENLNRDFENLGLESDQNGCVSDDLGDSGSDGSGNSSMQYPVRPDAMDCAFYMRTGTCMFGRTCKFNHPISRRNKAKSSVKSGPITCKFYLAGVCKYGEHCSFVHSKSEAEASSVQYNVVGLPIRPGEKECAFYMQTGMCGYGASCRFHHPCPIFVKGSEIYGSIATGESVELPDGASEVTDGGYALQLSETAQAYFSLPVITDSSPQYLHQDYVWDGYQVPKRTQEMKPSFAPQAVSVKKADDHFQGPPKREPCDLNDVGLPIRPGKKVCWNYRNLGLCKLGRACPYDHPKKYSFIVPDGSTSESPSGGKTQETEELNEQGVGISSGP